jgi:hypothetical protein
MIQSQQCSTGEFYEKKRNQQNEEMIRELQAQIEDLLLTMEVAENAKTA